MSGRKPLMAGRPGAPGQAFSLAVSTQVASHYRSTRALCLYRLWPPRWRKEVDRSVVRTFAATVQLLEKLRRDL